MSGGKHASDEEFDFEFDFGMIKNIVIIIVILAMIAGVILGVFKLVSKMKNAETEETSAELEEEIQETDYPVLGKIVIDKIGVEQLIFDSVEEEALEQGVIKLYGDTLNQERKFLYSGA